MLSRIDGIAGSSPRGRIVLVLALTIAHAAIAGVAASPVFYKPCIATAQRVFGGSNGPANLYEDVRAYADYGTRTLGGDVPYDDFLVEYPIGALPLFVAPAVFAKQTMSYRWAFAAEMMLFDAILIWLVIVRASKTNDVARSLLWYTLMLATLGALPIARFDLAATAMTFGAAMAWEAGRSGLGGVLAATGGLAKVFPLVVAGPGILSDRGLVRTLFVRDKGEPHGSGMRGLIGIIATIAIGTIAWFAIGGSGVGRSLGYHSGRGLEIESLYAGILIPISRVLGWPVTHDFNHSSVELIVAGASLSAKLSPFLQLAAMGLAMLLFVRGGARKDVVVAASGACVLAFAVFAKVLSPQYLVWIIPFAATWEGRAGRLVRPITLAACVLTTLLYFWAGVGLVNLHPIAVTILNARNGLLLVMFAIWLAALRPTPDRS